VEIGVNAQAYRSTGTPLPRRYRPQTVVDAQFSIPYAFATALVTGGVALSDFSDSALRRPDVLTVAGCVVVGIDPELDAAHGREVSPARARATLRDGRRLEVTVMQPLGGPGRALGRDDLVRKFRACCAWGSRSPAHTERLLGVISAGQRGAAADLFALLREAA
jgi:2-methylcitrate dehydratase PrpD